MKILPSARKHGLSDEDIFRAAMHTEWREYSDTWNPQIQFRVGFDTKGRLIETFVEVYENGDEIVFHAMKARKQFRHSPK